MFGFMYSFQLYECRKLKFYFGMLVQGGLIELGYWDGNGRKEKGEKRVSWQ